MELERRYAQLGSALVEARKKAGLGQADIAQSADYGDLLAVKSLSLYENGHRLAPEHVVERYETLCGVKGGRLMRQWLHLSLKAEVAREPWASARITLRFHEIDPNLYDVELEFSALKGKRKEIIYVVTETEALSDLISKECPAIDESLYAPSRQTAAQYAETIVNNHRVLGSLTGAGRSKRTTEVQFVDVTDQRWDEVLDGLAMDRREDVRILACPVDNLDERITLRGTSRNRLDPGLYFWNAIRPTYVETISIDVSRCSSRTQDRARTVRFLPATSVDSEFEDKARGGRFEISVDAWLQQGHGFVVYW